MNKLEAERSPEPMRQSDPLEGLLRLFRSRFKQAFRLRADQMSEIEDSARRHPSNHHHGVKNGTYMQRTRDAIEGLETFTIMQKMPEIGPNPDFDNTEAIEETLRSSGLSSGLDRDTRFLVHMPMTEALRTATAAEAASLIDEMDSFIVQFMDHDNAVTYVVDGNGIWPVAVEIGEAMNLDDALAELLSAEAENDVDDVVHKINQQNLLAQQWLDLLEQTNLVAFH